MKKLVALFSTIFTGVLLMHGQSMSTSVAFLKEIRKIQKTYNHVNEYHGHAEFFYNSIQDYRLGSSPGQQSSILYSDEIKSDLLKIQQSINDLNPNNVQFDPLPGIGTPGEDFRYNRMQANRHVQSIIQFRVELNQLKNLIRTSESLSNQCQQTKKSMKSLADTYVYLFNMFAGTPVIGDELRNLSLDFTSHFPAIVGASVSDLNFKIRRLQEKQTLRKNNLRVYSQQLKTFLNQEYQVLDDLEQERVKKKEKLEKESKELDDFKKQNEEREEELTQILTNIRRLKYDLDRYQNIHRNIRYDLHTYQQKLKCYNELECYRSYYNLCPSFNNWKNCTSYDHQKYRNKYMDQRTYKINRIKSKISSLNSDLEYYSKLISSTKDQLYKQERRYDNGRYNLDQLWEDYRKKRADLQNRIEEFVKNLWYLLIKDYYAENSQDQTSLEFFVSEYLQ